MFGDKLSLSWVERNRLRHEPAMTEAQHDRLLMLAVSGEPEGPTLTLAQRHLEFARDLVDRGRIGEGER